jgi:hypothetical protein
MLLTGNTERFYFHESSEQTGPLATETMYSPEGLLLQGTSVSGKEE